MTALGVEIARRLDEQGWTLREASERCGVHLATLASYKDGRILGRGPRAAVTVKKIGEGLGIPNAALLASPEQSDLDELVAMFGRLAWRDRRALLAFARQLHTAMRHERMEAAS